MLINLKEKRLEGLFAIHNHYILIYEIYIYVLSALLSESNVPKYPNYLCVH